MTIIVTQKYELYPDELLIPKIARGHSGHPISFMRAFQRLSNMSDEQWHKHAFRIIQETTKENENETQA